MTRKRRKWLQNTENYYKETKNDKKLMQNATKMQNDNKMT